MIAITCDKCRRRFTPTIEELQGHLKDSNAKKFGQVPCPHCGRGNKVAHERMVDALRHVHHATEAAPATGDALATEDAPAVEDAPA